MRRNIECPICGSKDGLFEETEPGEVNKSTSLLTERLIQAAVDYESGRCSRRELSEAREAVEAAILATVSDMTKQSNPSGIRESKSPCPGCDGHECDEGCQYPGIREGK